MWKYQVKSEPLSKDVERTENQVDVRWISYSDRYHQNLKLRKYHWENIKVWGRPGPPAVNLLKWVQ